VRLQPDGAVEDLVSRAAKNLAAIYAMRISSTSRMDLSAGAEIEHFLQDLGIGRLWNERQERVKALPQPVPLSTQI